MICIIPVKRVREKEIFCTREENNSRQVLTSLFTSSGLMILYSSIKIPAWYLLAMPMKPAPRVIHIDYIITHTHKKLGWLKKPHTVQVSPPVCTVPYDLEIV